MFLHIGGDVSIPKKMILGIFDFDSLIDNSEMNVELLSRKEEKGQVENISFDLPRSIVFALDKIYITPISPRTLRSRIDDPGVWE